jgi:hypothetical protein
VERQRGSGDAELVCDHAGRESLRPALDQQTKHGKPGFLSESAQRFNDTIRFHIFNSIEVLIARQG